MKNINDIYDYLHDICPKEGTLIETALNYFLNYEEKSKTFLEDGHILISNDICERAIKPFTIMRRNVLFAKSRQGARLSGRLFTIIQTARPNGLVVDKYIEYVLEKMNKIPVEDLLPWSGNPH